MNPKRQEVLAASVAARDAIQAARFVTGIRDRIQRYITHDYPAQLALASRLASAEADGHKGSARRRTPCPLHGGYHSRPQCNLPYISTEEDLDDWLEALREAALAELKAAIASASRIVFLMSAG